MESSPPRDPEFYRKEAERLRFNAKSLTNETVRRQVLAIADSYDGLAETVEIINRHRGMGQ